MLCDICGKKIATVHLTEIINGEVKELHLCEECALKKSQEVQKQFSLADILAGLVEEVKRVNVEVKKRLVGRIIRVFVAEKSMENRRDAMGYPVRDGPLVLIRGGGRYLGGVVEVRIRRVLSDRLLEGEVARVLGRIKRLAQRAPS